MIANNDRPLDDDDDNRFIDNVSKSGRLRSINGNFLLVPKWAITVVIALAALATPWFAWVTVNMNTHSVRLERMSALEERLSILREEVAALKARIE